MYIITKDECEKIEAIFCLETTRSEKIEAFITYFEIEFTACHRPVKMSTAPNSSLSYWKPMVFFLNSSETLTVDANERVYGRFQMTTQAECNRHLDMEIDVCYRGRFGYMKEFHQYELR